jgi:glycogen operon protein
MGDEVRRTQQGNNNAYCQDNDISWFDWRLVERHADLHRFVRLLNTYRQRRDPTGASSPTSLTELIERARIRWSGVDLDRPDWGDHSHTLAVTLESQRGAFLLHAIFNAYWEPLAFELPPSPTSYHVWRRCIDTALASPDDICHIGDAPEVTGARYVAQPRSVVVLALGPGAMDRHDGPGGRTGAHEPDWRQ